MNSLKLATCVITKFLEQFPNVPDLEKLLKKIRILPDKGCWIVTEDWSVYARFNHEPAHRFMYRVFYEDNITGFIICHKCDRPGCIKPDHLFKGTHLINMRDARKKGRKKDIGKNGWMGGSKSLNKLREEDNLRQLTLPVDYHINSYYRKG